MEKSGLFIGYCKRTDNYLISFNSENYKQRCVVKGFDSCVNEIARGIKGEDVLSLHLFWDELPEKNEETLISLIKVNNELCRLKKET